MQSVDGEPPAPSGPAVVWRMRRDDGVDARPRSAHTARPSSESSAVSGWSTPARRRRVSAITKRLVRLEHRWVVRRTVLRVDLRGSPRVRRGCDRRTHRAGRRPRSLAEAHRRPSALMPPEVEARLTTSESQPCAVRKLANGVTGRGGRARQNGSATGTWRVSSVQSRQAASTRSAAPSR